MITILHNIWRMSFQACILILIVLITRQLLKKYSAFYTRLLWLPVIVRLLCPVFIETDFSLLPEFSAIQTEKGSDGKAAAALVSASLAANRLADNFTRQAFWDTEALPSSFVPNTADRPFSYDNLPPNAQSMISVPENGALLPQTAPPEPNTTKSAPKSDVLKPAALSRLFRLLPALYLLGAAITAVIFSAQFLRLKRRLSAAVCESGNVWLCENIASPFVLGILRPKIILPYHMEPEAKAHVLSHERTHIRHCDPLLHFAGTTCLCLHWWNPFVWLAVHKMNQDMEMFCDESTLRLATTPQRKAYAKTLLSFAEQQSSLHAGPAFGESNTERRVKNIMQKKKKNFLVFGLIVLLAVFCTTAFMTVPKAAKNEDEAKTISSDNNNTGADTSPTPSIRAGENLPADTSQDSENHIVFTSDLTISSLQYVSLSIPNFQGKQEMDAAFWKEYLFDTFKNAYSGEPAREYVIEDLPYYSEQIGLDIPYRHVMAYDLDRLTRKLFGTTLSELGLAPESLADGKRIIYEDGVYGSYYFADTGSSDIYTYGLAVEEPAPDGKTKLVFPKYLVNENFPLDDVLLLSQVTLYLQPAENEYGYIIVGKEELMAKDIKNDDVLSRILISDIGCLQQAGIVMQDFTKETDLDAAFFQDYLFRSSYQISGGEKVNRYSKRRDMTTAYLKIDAETLDRKIQRIFGKALSSYVKNPQDLTDEDGDIIFEDGCYYIRIPHSGNYTFDEAKLTVIEDGKSAELSFLKHSASSAYPSSKITLYLTAAATKNSYILVGKEEIEYDFTFRTLTGTWLVTDYFIPPDSQISDLSQENIEAFIGTLLRFGPDYLRVGSHTYPVSEYQKEPVTAGEFDALFRLSATEELSITSDRFDYYRLQTEGELPFGNYVYRYDFEKALVVYEGVIYRINWLTDVLDKETSFDESADFVFALPDENGFVNGPIISYVMLPGSILYYTDDTHYIIVEGGIEMNTPQKVEEYNATKKANGIDIIRKGAKTSLAVNRPSDEMILTYDMYGGLMHIYPRDYPREKLAEGFLNWCCENEFCRAVAAGLDGEQPKVYYKATGKNWDFYPLPGLENLTDEERDSLVLEADEQKIHITVIKDGEKIVKEIEVNQ